MTYSVLERMQYKLIHADRTRVCHMHALINLQCTSDRHTRVTGKTVAKRSAYLSMQTV